MQKSDEAKKPKYRFRNLRLFFGIGIDKIAIQDRKFKPAIDALDDRIIEFTLAADKYKLRFRVFQVIVILASAIIPIINLSDIATSGTRIVSSILGSLIVIVTGLTQMDKNHEMWILKASVEHALKHEKLLFINCVYPYNKGDARQKDADLIKNMNTIISSFLESYFNVAAGSRQNLTNLNPNTDTTNNRDMTDVTTNANTKPG